AVLDVGLQDAGEVPAGAPAIGSGPEHPQLAPIDRERTHLHEHLIGPRHWLGNIAQGDPAGSRAVCNERAHPSGLRNHWSLTARVTGQSPSALTTLLRRRPQDRPEPLLAHRLLRTTRRPV